MSKKILKELSDAVGDDVVVKIESINHVEAFVRLPDVSISDNGSVRSLKVYAYAAESKENVLLHKLFGKVRDQG